MVALNFMAQFAPDVEAGRKRQSIRDNTKARAGSPLQLYTGMRHKSCRKLRDEVCKSVTPLMLMERLAQPRGNVALTGIYLEEFAQADGFKTYADMWEFFKNRANAEGEYHGFLIKW